MGFLITSIICSVLVSVLLKIARPKNINLPYAIMANYIVCIQLSWLTLKPTINITTLQTGGWVFALLGLLLPSVFLIMGKSVEIAGIVKSDTAQRLALIIPVIASFTLFDETLNINKAFALLLTFVAMGCLLYKKDKHFTSQHNSHWWLLGVFLGYGIIDVLLKYLSKIGSAAAGSLMISFILAWFVMATYLLIKKIKPDFLSIAFGLLLGLLNFTNIYTYIHAHKVMSDTPALVFTSMNIGVIILGTLTGVILFKEKISRINGLGIILALFAIIKLYL